MIRFRNFRTAGNRHSNRSKYAKEVEKNKNIVRFKRMTTRNHMDSVRVKTVGKNSEWKNGVFSVLLKGMVRYLYIGASLETHQTVEKIELKVRASSKREHSGTDSHQKTQRHQRRE